MSIFPYWENLIVHKTEFLLIWKYSGEMLRQHNLWLNGINLITQWKKEINTRKNDVFENIFNK